VFEIECAKNKNINRTIRVDWLFRKLYP